MNSVYTARSLAATYSKAGKERQTGHKAQSVENDKDAMPEEFIQFFGG